MMLPLIGSPLLQIEMQVFARRRAAAKLLFASAYFLAWSAALSAALAVLLALRGAGAAAWAAEPLLFVAAAAWQGTHLKRRALQACHRPGRFRAGGAGANADMRRFGLQHGAACIAACWTVMLPMLLGEHGLLPGLAATLVLFAERHEMRPQIRASQVILLLLALLTALPA
jgi:predicted metal-binding membrane protein